MNNPQPERSSLQRAREIAEAALSERTPAGASPSDKVTRQIKDDLATLPKDSPAALTRGLSYLLDDLVRIPGTKYRIGLDPVLSLIPAAGSTAGAAMGAVVLFDAVRLRAPISVITRMLSNYVIDWLIGMVPFLGSVFDVAYRSNHKNLRLLRRTIASRDETHKASTTYWLGMGGLVLVVVALVIGVPIALLVWLNHVGMLF